MAWMQHVATSVARSVVCLSVLCHADVPCKNGWPERVAILGADSGGPNKPCIRCGWDHPQEAAILGRCSAHWKALGLCAAVHAAKWIIRCSVAVWQPTAVFPSGRCHVTLYPMKNLFLPHDSAFCQNSLTNCSCKPFAWVRRCYLCYLPPLIPEEDLPM